MYLDENGSLTVSETVVFDFGNTLKKGEICRTLHVAAHAHHKREVNALVHVQEVTNDSGCTLKHESKHSGKEHKVVIKDTRKQIFGLTSYKINYTVENAVVVAGGLPELNWNATGNWSIPVEKSSVKLFLPKDTRARVVHWLIATNGSLEVGANRRRCQTSTRDNEIDFTVSTLLPGEALNIAVGLPAASVKPPPAKVVEAEDFLKHWKALLVVPAAVTIMLAGYWLLFGRDQAIKEEDERQDDWRPPSDLTPAEAGTLIDERCDKPDIVATLIDLASRGYLRITEKPYHGIQMRSEHDYEFTRLSPPVLETLKPHEELFVRNLFGFVNDKDVLSNMRGHFHEHLQMLNRSVWESLLKGQFFLRHPEQDRRIFKWMSGFLFLLGGIAFFTSQGEPRLAGAGSLLAGLIVALSATAMPARTSKGAAALKQLKAFKQFVHDADRQTIEQIYQEDRNVFSRYLSYAIVLKLGDKWSDHFEDVIKELPAWYERDPHGTFSPHWLAKDLRNALATIQSVFLEPPPVGTPAVDIVSPKSFD